MIKHSKSEPLKWSFLNGHCDFKSSVKACTFGNKQIVWALGLIDTKNTLG